MFRAVRVDGRQQPEDDGLQRFHDEDGITLTLDSQRQ